MSERIRLDPLVNQRVIFKLRGQDHPMESTILGFDDTGYWIKGGTLVEYLNAVEQKGDDVCFLESSKIEWFQRAPSRSK